MDMSNRQAIQLLNGLESTKGIIKLEDLPFGVNPDNVQKAFQILFWDEGAEYTDGPNLVPVVLSTDSQTGKMFPEGKPCAGFDTIASALTSKAMEQQQVFFDDQTFSEVVEQALIAKAQREEAREALPAAFFGKDSGFLPLLSQMVDAGVLPSETIAQFEGIALQHPQKVIGVIGAAIEAAVHYSEDLQRGDVMGMGLMIEVHGCGNPDCPHCSSRETDKVGEA